MGYSSPKKQLDLKDFLSQPATKAPFRRFGLRKPPTAPAAAEPPAPESEDAAG